MDQAGEQVCARRRSQNLAARALVRPSLSRSARWRALTAFQSLSLTMRRSGTSSIIKWLTSFRRDRRPPVAGSFKNRCRFHTRRPTYSSLLRIPVPRVVWPRIAVSRHARPRRPATPSLLSPLAIARGLRPGAYSSRIRTTTAASASLIFLAPVWPGTGRTRSRSRRRTCRCAPAPRGRGGSSERGPSGRARSLCPWARRAIR
jgi:hypothetical protein